MYLILWLLLHQHFVMGLPPSPPTHAGHYLIRLWVHTSAYWSFCKGKYVSCLFSEIKRSTVQLFCMELHLCSYSSMLELNENSQKDYCIGGKKGSGCVGDWWARHGPVTPSDDIVSLRFSSCCHCCLLLVETNLHSSFTSWRFSWTTTPIQKVFF